MADLVPTPIEREAMKKQADDARETAASKAAYDKASPIGKSIPIVKKAKGGSIRGSGCEQRGKTRGKFV